MGIFDIDDNIEALKPAREIKFKKLFESMRDGSQMVVMGVVDDVLLVFKEMTEEVKNSEIPFIADDDDETSAWGMILTKDLDVDVERMLDEVEKSDSMRPQLVFIYPDMQLKDFVRHIVVHTPIAVWKDAESQEICKSLFEMTEEEIERCDDMVKWMEKYN